MAESISYIEKVRQELLASKASEVPKPVGSQPAASSYSSGSPPRSTSPEITKIPPAPNDLSKVFLHMNPRAKLRKGWLLLTVQKDNTVHQMDPATGQTELVFRILGTPMLLWRAIPLRDGSILASISGTRWPGHSDEIAFGGGGFVLHIDHRNDKWKNVEVNGPLVDPGDLTLLENGDLIVTDFNGFGGSGKITLVPNATQRILDQPAKILNAPRESLPMATLFEGNPLKEPTDSVLTPDGNWLIIANSFMYYHKETGPGGRIMDETGSVVALNLKTSEVKILHDESSMPRGAIDSVGLNRAGTKLLFTRNDWPHQENGAVSLLDLKTGNVKVLKAADDKSAIFVRVTSSESDQGIMYVADSYNQKLWAVDAEKETISESHSLSHLLGGGTGMVSPVETVEYVQPIGDMDEEHFSPRSKELDIQSFFRALQDR